ncbi:pectinesterase family protein [Flavobacterium sp. GSA192]|uniref:pectinesterase family protein n=1 Tax=Flavobacterium sp. GSA192 TaxID=2576304 RepID=UPI00112848B6|nr:pectinesterase family protein [Flavobacterium sp. GSA192]
MRNVIRLKYILFFLFISQFFFAQTANPEKYKYQFVVAKDGSGDYKYIQDAIDAMRKFPLAPITLYIKNGVYNEKIELSANNTDVTFIGESVDKTIITYNDYSGRGKMGTFNSYTAKISGNRFKAENITFENSAGRVGQAVALYVDADKAVFKNCKFLGNQDTIYHGGEYSRQFFVDCHIEGTTDFIFGPATAVFKNCTILCKANSYITAPNTPKDKEFGFVFMDCKVSVTSEVDKMYLGRPWRAWAKSVFIKCELPKQIAPAAWDNWGNVENEKTAFFAEYECSGEGFKPKERASWTHQLKKAEAERYTLKTILGSNSKSSEKEWYEL